MQYSFRIVKIEVVICTIVLFTSLLSGQNAAQQNPIAASQAGASPLNFYPEQLGGRSCSLLVSTILLNVRSGMDCRIF